MKYFLFKRFDQGIKLDEESYFSVIPEEIGEYLSSRLQGFPIKFDAFCGSGGLLI